MEKTQERKRASELMEDCCRNEWGTKFMPVEVGIRAGSRSLPTTVQDLEKGENQSHVKFALDLTTHFTRWCSASGMDDFEGLYELIVLEQFKNCIPVHVATYISEQKAKKPNYGKRPSLMIMG